MDKILKKIPQAFSLREVHNSGPNPGAQKNAQSVAGRQRRLEEQKKAC